MKRYLLDDRDIQPIITSALNQGDARFVNVSGDTMTGKLKTPSVSANYLQVNTGVTVTPSAGTMTWNTLDKTIDVGLENGSVLQLGQEEILYATNKTGSTITNGQIVKVTGSSGNRVVVSLGQATSAAQSISVFAIATQTIANNGSGYFTRFGIVRDINTGSWLEGDLLWLSTSAGTLTNVQPAKNYTQMPVAIVTRAHATVGTIMVSPTLVPRLKTLGDVENYTSATEGNYLAFNNGLWRPRGNFYNFEDVTQKFYDKEGKWDSTTTTVSANSASWATTTHDSTLSGNGTVSSPLGVVGVFDTYKVQIDADDESGPGYLAEKITAGDNIVLTRTTGEHGTRIEIKADVPVISATAVSAFAVSQGTATYESGYDDVKFKTSAIEFGSFVTSADETVYANVDEGYWQVNVHGSVNIPDNRETYTTVLSGDYIVNSTSAAVSTYLPLGFEIQGDATLLSGTNVSIGKSGIYQLNFKCDLGIKNLSNGVKFDVYHLRAGNLVKAYRCGSNIQLDDDTHLVGYAMDTAAIAVMIDADLNDQIVVHYDASPGCYIDAAHLSLDPVSTPLYQGSIHLLKANVTESWTVVDTLDIAGDFGSTPFSMNKVFNCAAGDRFKIALYSQDGTIELSNVTFSGHSVRSMTVGSGSTSGVSDGKVKVTSAGTADYLVNKIEAASGSPITVTIVDDTLVLDAIQDDISDPLIRTIGLMNENGLFGFGGNCYSNVWEDGEWDTGLQQNTTDAFYRVSVEGRGTITKVKFFINSFNDVDYGVSASGNFGAVRIGLFTLDGTCKGQTAWVRGLSALGTTTLDMTPCSGQNLTIERNTEYWIGIVARGMQLISYNKADSGFDPGNNALRYALSIRATSMGASWSPNFWNTSGGGFIQNKVPVILMSSTE